MSAAAPNPNNMLILAAIGIGAFWLMSRRAVASPLNGLTMQQQADRQAQAQKAGLLSAGLGAFAGLLGKLGGGSGGGGAVADLSDYAVTIPGAIGTFPNPFNPYVLTDGADYVAMNPAGAVAPFDWFQNITLGS